MKISIIIPVYNAMNIIHMPIASLIKQSFNDFEVILVNDGSTDNSIEIIEGLIIDDKRFIIINQENNGPGSARNAGIKVAKGEYIGFIDSDDYFDKSFLGKMVTKINDENSDIVICDTLKVDFDGNIIKSYICNYKKSISGIEAFEDIMKSINITSLSQNKLFRKILFRDVYYPKNILVNEDSATIYKLMLKANKVSFVHESLFYYVQHPSSTMNSFNKTKIDDRIKVSKLIKADLINKKLLDKYIIEYQIYYLLNVILSASVQIAKQSNNYTLDMKYLFNKFDKDIFTYKNIFLLKKFHLKKAIALFVLKVSKILFYLIAKKVG
jgi:glycosyltransferase involved in cell wall biosynthesis